MFLREAEAYLRSAQILRDAETSPDAGWSDWANRNPIAFLLLHATELSLKSLAFLRRQTPENTHDIVLLARQCARGSKAPEGSDLNVVRRAYTGVRALGEQRVRDKWSDIDSDYAKAGFQIELQTVRKQPVGLMQTFKTLGALGQSKLVKMEFGEEVEKWWHGARYPRHGTTSYPDYEACVLICTEIIHVAQQEMST